MKKTIKINFVNWGWNPKDNFFINRLKKYYRVILSKKPGFLFFGINPPAKESHGLRRFFVGISPKNRKHITTFWQNLCASAFFGRFLYRFFQDEIHMPILKTKAIRIFYTAENCRPDMDNCEWAFTFDYDEELKNPRHLRLPYYKLEAEDTKNLVRENINIKKIMKQKTKFCAFIYSKNVPFRNKFFRKLSKYKKVDAPGDSMRNMPPIPEPNKSSDLRFIPNQKNKGWQKRKIEFLKPYKFVIAFENSSYPGYTTEKMYHPMLAKSIPIYWGNSKVYRDFNTKSFLNYYDFEKIEKEKFPKIFFKISILRKIIQRLIIEPRTIKKMIKKIVEIDKNDELYEKYLKEPWYPDNKPTKYVDDEIINKRLREIFNEKNKKI